MQPPEKKPRTNAMSRFHFKLPEKLRRISAVSGGSGGSPMPGSRTRRPAFSATHFKKEKVMKQLQTGIEKGDTSQVEYVVDTVDNITDLEEGNISFVRRACELGNLDIVALLLRSGASVNLIGDGNCAPIHVAARQGNTSMIAILLSNSANPNGQAKYEKKTPLHIATLEGHIEAIRLLLANGADVNCGDIYGSRPIHVACRMGRVQILNTLLESHAKIDAYDNEGWTALHLAAEAGHESIVKILLDRNANIDSQSKYGRTPLHWACVSGHANVVHNLLLKGASANIRDLHEHLPLYYARNDRVKALVSMHTDKPGTDKKFASSIGLYLNFRSAEGVAGDSQPGSPYEGSPALADAKVRKWISADILPLSRTTSSSIDDDVVDASGSGHLRKRSSLNRKASNQPSSTVVMPSHEVLTENIGNMMPKTSKKAKPSLSTTFKKMTSTVNGHMDDLAKSVGVLDDAIGKLAVGDETGNGFTAETGLKYWTELKHINNIIKSLKEDFTSNSGDINTLINECSSESKVMESSGPTYIALVQMMVHSIAVYVGKQQNDGWKVFLNRLPISEEKAGILSFQLQMQTSVPETEKVKQVIMHWARGCDLEDKVLYMRTLLLAVQKCEFEENGTDHADRVLEELLNEETHFKTGDSDKRRTKLSHLASSLHDNEIRHVLHHIEAVTDPNIFPTLNELSVSESDNEAPVARNSPKTSVKSACDRLEEILYDVIEEEDTKKLVAAIKQLIISGREDLVSYVL